MAIIGIDLGTTNSLACTWQNGRCVIIPNRFGKELTPSAVSIDEDGTLYIGAIAKERLITHPDDSIALFKRTMGSNQIYTLQGKQYTSEELSSFVIRQLVDDAKAYLQEEIEEAIISVPAYFNDAQRSATKQAGALAGIKVERLINEPSAAALFARSNQDEECFLIFDFGGGTLDISIVECFEQIISILAVSGDNHLGGSDFDRAIADAFCEENDLFFEDLSPQEERMLLRQCEEMKIMLSQKEEVTNQITFKERIYSFTLSSRKLIMRAPDLFERLLTPIHKALHDAGRTPHDLDQIIMVGGSSKMPTVKSYLEMKLERTILNHNECERIVAMGIGMYAGIKQRAQDIKDLILTDICPFTLGINIHNESDPNNPYMHAIIERNSPLPSSVEHNFYTIHDDQKAVDIKIFQGESMYANHNLLLGKTEVKVKQGKAGEYPIKVRFTYDINGILDVDILDTGSQNKETLLITPAHTTMSEAEIEKARKALEKLKFHPREEDQNKLILSRLERLFEESTMEQREYIITLHKQFEAVLEKQDRIQIEVYRKKFEAIVDTLERELHPYQPTYH